MQTAIFATIASASCIAVITDLRYGKIYNWLTAGAGLAVLMLVLTTPDIETARHMLSLIMMILISVPLFSLGLMGGGDIKLLYVLALAFPYTDFLMLFFAICVAGGILALYLKIFHPSQTTMPYAVPICMGLLSFILYLYLYDSIPYPSLSG